MQKDLSSLPGCSASLCLSSCFPSFLETYMNNEEVLDGCERKPELAGAVCESCVQSWCCVCCTLRASIKAAVDEVGLDALGMTLLE